MKERETRESKAASDQTKERETERERKAVSQQTKERETERVNHQAKGRKERERERVRVTQPASVSESKKGRQKTGNRRLFCVGQSVTWIH